MATSLKTVGYLLLFNVGTVGTLGFAQTMVTPTVTTDQTRVGPLPFSSSIGSGVEAVDLASGALQVNIPLFSVSARGVTSNFGITYNSNVFADLRAYDAGGNPVFKLGVNGDGGWRTTGAGLRHTTLVVKCYDYTTANKHTETYQTNYSFTDSSFSKHSLAAQFAGGSCGGSFSDAGPDMDAQGIWASGGGSTIRLANGTMALVTVGTQTGVFVDPNGNIFSNKTDPLNRPLYTSTQTTNADGSPTVTYTYKDSNGTSQIVVVTWAKIQVSTHFGSGGDIPTGGQQNMVQSIQLANGQSYVFHYDATWGQVSEVDLPSGGVITYGYSNTYGGGNSEGFYQEGNRRYVSSRTETANGTSATWTINIPSYAEYVGAPSTSTVTYPSLHQSVFTSVNGAVTDAKVYSGTVTGTPLREYAIGYATDATPFNDSCFTDYAGDATPPEYPSVGRRPVSILTKLENGLQSKKEFDYDSVSYTYASAHCNMGPVEHTYTTSRGNVTQSREYDWGAGAPGALLRKTDKTYLHVSGTNAAQYLAANIVNKVISDQVSDAGGTVFSNTQYTYDDYTTANGSGFTARSSAPGHDYTDVPDTNKIRGNLTQVQRYLNTTGSWLRTAYSYDDLGNVTAIQDPLLHTTSWAYDDSWSSTDSACLPASNSFAYPTQVTDALGHVTKTSYYDCTGKTRSVQDPNDIANAKQGTVSIFDPMGRETSRSMSDGGTVTKTYTDTVPNKVNSAAKITTSLTESTVSELDGLGRPRKSTLSSDPDGATYGRTLYDGEGRVSQVWNPTRCDPDTATSCTGETTFGYTTHSYDALNRELKMIPPDGSTTANNVTTTFTGNTTTITDEIGVKNLTTVDGLGRMSQVKEVNTGWITNYFYDILGNLTCVEQQGGVTGTGCSSAVTNDASSPWRVRRFTYDSLSRLLAAKNPEAGTSTATCNGSTNPWSICYAYNNDGVLTGKTDTRGITINYSPTAHPIDALHRITGKTYSNGDPSVTYIYDSTSVANGILRRTGMSDASGSATWSYDSMGREASESRTIGSITKLMSTLYNLDGSVWKITYPSTSVVEYAPGAGGRALSVQDDTHSIQFAKTASYAPQGDLKSLVLGYTSSFAGITFSDQYNTRLQPAVISAATPSATLMSLSYDFHLGAGDNGNVFGITNNKDTSRSQIFAYSMPNRLQQAKAGSLWGATFTYDAWGNLYQTGTVAGTAVQAMSVNQVPDNANRFTLNGYGYDAAGNVLNDGINTGCGTNGFAWNAEAQMTCGAGATYTYDGNGARVKKSSGTLYWGSGPLAESDLSGTLTSEYIFFNGKRVVRRDIASGSIYYYISDHLGSSNVVTNATGGIQNESDFYPFGGERQVVMSLANQHYKFTGKERDTESGSDYFGARYYASNMGRFTSPDWSARVEPVPYAKLDKPQSLNLYSFLNNNPLRTTDPDGHDGDPCGNGTPCDGKTHVTNNPNGTETVTQGTKTTTTSVDANGNKTTTTTSTMSTVNLDKHGDVSSATSSTSTTSATTDPNGNHMGSTSSSSSSTLDEHSSQVANMRSDGVSLMQMQVTDLIPKSWEPKVLDHFHVTGRDVVNFLIKDIPKSVAFPHQHTSLDDWWDDK